MDNMNNTEFDNFDIVAMNAEHINKQDCAIKEKHSELFGCFDPEKKSSIISMICLMVYVFSLKIMMTKNFL